MNRLVFSNHGYDPCSGGVKALHYLQALIHSSGIPVAGTYPCFFDPLIPVVAKCQPDDIAVYPDVDDGNPLEADRIVRYLLYFPRLPNYRIPRTDCVILYMDTYRKECEACYDGRIWPDALVEVPNIEAADWCYPEEKSIKNVLYTGKENCKEKPDITYQPMPDLSDPDRWKLRYSSLALLRRSANFYTMDHHTVMDREAVMCGCNVFHVHGGRDFREVHPDIESRIMRPQNDLALGSKFVSIIQDFFEL